MGFSYGLNYKTGKYQLACDFCGNIGGVRKIKCPYGYCQPYAVCLECKKAKRHLLLNTSNANHKNCKHEMEEQHKLKLEALAGGLTIPIRKWGVNGNDGGEERELYCIDTRNGFKHWLAISSIMHTVWMNLQQLAQLKQMNNNLIFTDCEKPNLL